MCPLLGAVLSLCCDEQGPFSSCSAGPLIAAASLVGELWPEGAWASVARAPGL